jgi:DnaJ-class molecular chaperone
MHVLPETDDTTDECPRCGGSGEVDIFLDDWGRDVLRDVKCPACDGSGRIQVVF